MGSWPVYRFVAIQSAKTLATEELAKRNEYVGFSYLESLVPKWINDKSRLKVKLSRRGARTIARKLAANYFGGSGEGVGDFSFRGKYGQVATRSLLPSDT